MEKEKLPSVRYLAKYLSISKTTVENAYQQLLVEGYIYSKPQKGYFISKLDQEFVMTRSEVIYEIEKDEQDNTYVYDYKSEYVEELNFDFNVWKKHINYVINYNKDKLYTYGNIQGEEELREEILKYVYRTRGVITKPNNIVIGAGVQPLLNVLSIVIKKSGIINLAMEDPGFNSAKSVFIHNDFNLIPISVNERGIDINELINSSSRLCYVSPSHQFPTGAVIPIDKRMKLLKWANEKDGYIIEDDYNSELRYEGKPIPAMQGLDSSRVIYLGSFSTVLVPSIRISFIILPDGLKQKYIKEIQNYAQTSSKIEQLALARMMKEGDFERHIRKIRKNYSKKNEYTLSLIRKYIGDKGHVISNNSGLNIMLKLKRFDEDIVIEKAKKCGLNISTILEHTIKKDNQYKNILLLSFRGIKTSELEESIKLLSGII
jgi:GntR family transcriptional regulator/MocR family aminotransferase